MAGACRASRPHIGFTNGLDPERRPVELTVLEAKDRLGGVLWTERRDGFTLEGGPDSFITNKPWGIDLCDRLGLSSQVVETDASHRRSFVVRNGRLAPVPEGFVLMAPHRILPILTTPILSWRGKLRFLMDLAVPRRDDESEESLAAFVRRRLGAKPLIGWCNRWLPASTRPTPTTSA